MVDFRYKTDKDRTIERVIQAGFEMEEFVDISKNVVASLKAHAPIEHKAAVEWFEGGDMVYFVGKFARN